MPQGTVCGVVPNRGFGFIRLQAGEGEVFFHVRDTDSSLSFDDQLLERVVQFEIKQTDRGPRAVNVRSL